MELSEILEPLGKFISGMVTNHGKGFLGGVMAFLVFYRWGWPWQWTRKKKEDG